MPANRKRNVSNMLIAFPPDVREWIEERSDQSMAPMNAIVVAAVRRTMAADPRYMASFDQDLVGGDAGNAGRQENG
jgi:hypothetical protein